MKLLSPNPDKQIQMRERIDDLERTATAILRDIDRLTYYRLEHKLVLKIIRNWLDYDVVTKEIIRLRKKLHIPVLPLYLLRNDHTAFCGDRQYKRSLTQIISFLGVICGIWVISGILSIFIMSKALDIVSYTMFVLLVIIGIACAVKKIRG